MPRPRPTGCIEIAMGNEVIEQTSVGRVILMRHLFGTYSIVYDGDLPKSNKMYSTRWMPPETVAAVEAELGGKYTFGKPPDIWLGGCAGRGSMRVGRGSLGRDSAAASDVWEALARARRTGDYRELEYLAEDYAAYRIGIHGDEESHPDFAIELLANPHRWNSSYFDPNRWGQEED